MTRILSQYRPNRAPSSGSDAAANPRDLRRVAVATAWHTRPARVAGLSQAIPCREGIENHVYLVRFVPVLYIMYLAVVAVSLVLIIVFYDEMKVWESFASPLE